MNKHASAIQTCTRMPDEPCVGTIYRLLPHNADEAYYAERVDRNLGWITADEQRLLRTKVVGIAGCGGMGGLLASILFRLGVGEVRIADCEEFDMSNINRQYAATRETVGRSKAFETARMIRAVTDDATLVVYGQGIVEETVESFLAGCDLVCDEIEFWAVGSRILLHRRAMRAGVPVLNCSTVGFGTRLFLFDQTGMSMERMLGMTEEEAMTLQRRIQAKAASSADVQHAMSAVLCALIPELPEYGVPGAYQSVPAGLRRLRNECRAPIIATNPPMASGFAADHALFSLLDAHKTRRIVRPPRTPGYLYFDAAFMSARAVERLEVDHAAY